MKWAGFAFLVDVLLGTTSEVALALAGGAALIGGGSVFRGLPRFLFPASAGGGWGRAGRAVAASGLLPAFLPRLRESIFQRRRS